MRRNISSSRLVRLLGDWAPVDMETPGMDFAERLSLWVNAFDAIGLRAAHQSIRTLNTAAPGRPDPRQAPVKAMTEDVLRVRTALAKLIAKATVGFAEADAPDLLTAAETSYAPCHQLHLKLQREMEQMIGPLRDRVRQTLGRVAPKLRQLAALDAVLEQVIAPREQMLLPTVSNLMSRRFEQLRQAHLQTQTIEAGQQDDPATWRQAGGWLAVFGNDWRHALLSELDLRLEPVIGLVEALRNESKNQP